MKLSTLFRFSSPLFMYVVFFTVFIFSECIFRLLRDEKPQFFNQWMMDLIICNLFVVLAVFIFILIRLSRPLGGALSPTLGVIHYSWVKKVMAVTLVLMSILVFIGWLSVGNPFGNPLAFRQAIQGGGAAYFFVCFIFMLKLSGIIYFNAIYTKTVTVWMHVYSAFLIFFSLSTGFASLFAYFFLAGLLYVNLRYGVRVVRFSVVFGVICLIVMTPFYTLVREGVMFGGGDLLEIFNLFKTRLLDNFFVVIFDRFDYFDLQVAGSHVARVNSEFSYIFNSFFQMIPRAIYPDKPPTYSTLMTSFYAPFLFDIGVTINFGYINEFTLYFGDFGPAVAGIFFGGLVLYGYTKVESARSSTVDAIFYVLIVHSYITAFMGGGFINDMPVAILLISYVLSKLLRMRSGVFDWSPK